MGLSYGIFVYIFVSASGCTSCFVSILGRVFLMVYVFVDGLLGLVRTDARPRPSTDYMYAASVEGYSKNRHA